MVEISWEHENSIYQQTFSKGESFFIPASLNEYEIMVLNPANYIVVNIPEFK